MKVNGYIKLPLIGLLALMPSTFYATSVADQHSVSTTMKSTEFKAFIRIGAQLGLVLGGLYGAGVGLSSFWTNPQVIALAGGPAAGLYTMLTVAPASAFIGTAFQTAWLGFIGVCLGAFGGVLGGTASYAGTKLAPLIFTHKHAPMAGAVMAGAIISPTVSIPVWLGALHAFCTERLARYKMSTASTCPANA